MKNLLKIGIVTLLCSIFFTCSQDELQKNEKSLVTLKFLVDQDTNQNKSSDENLFLDVVAEVVVVNGLPKLISEELIEVSAVNSENNQLTYVYVLKSDYDETSARSASNVNNKSGCTFSTRDGFGFTGNCFEYGTFYTGTDCSQTFIPCGLPCFTFGRICAAENEGWA